MTLRGVPIEAKSGLLSEALLRMLRASCFMATPRQVGIKTFASKPYVTAQLWQCPALWPLTSEPCVTALAECYIVAPCF